jgi:biopolymer transport protein ExbD
MVNMGSMTAGSGKPVIELDADAGGAIPARKRVQEESTFDITAMIDLVFMMNIFFMVTTIGAVANELELPTAQHCVAADVDNAIVITIAAGGSDGSTPIVYLGDGKAGDPINDPSEQEKQVMASVESGIERGLTLVVIKADRELRYKDIARLTNAASAPEGAKLHLAVMERN